MVLHTLKVTSRTFEDPKIAYCSYINAGSWYFSGIIRFSQFIHLPSGLGLEVFVK